MTNVLIKEANLDTETDRHSEGYAKSHKGRMTQDCNKTCMSQESPKMAGKPPEATKRFLHGYRGKVVL
jgi:hypothetical protein